MTRSELIKSIYNNFPHLTLDDADKTVRLILEQITQALEHGQRIEIRGFGSFKTTYRKQRVARNPRNGAKVEVAAKYVPRFRASRELQKRLNKKSVVNSPSDN